jgi:hypothetical protein
MLLNVARCMKNTDDLQWFCFVPIDHQVPEKWLFRSKERRYRTELVLDAPRKLLCGMKSANGTITGQNYLDLDFQRK